MKTENTVIAKAPSSGTNVGGTTGLEKDPQTKLNETLLSFREKGEVPLDEIIKKVGEKFTRHDVIAQLKTLQKQKEGSLIVGRRGHTTRFSFGVVKPTKRHYTTKTAPVVEQTQTQPTNGNGEKHNYFLRLHLNNEIVKTIPLELDLVAA
jgi:hypothetical protein